MESLALEKGKRANQKPREAELGGIAIGRERKTTAQTKELEDVQKLRLKEMLKCSYPEKGVDNLSPEELEIIRRALPPLMDFHKIKLLGQQTRSKSVHLLRLNAWLDGTSVEDMVKDHHLAMPGHTNSENAINLWKVRFGKRIGSIFPKLGELIVPDVEQHIERMRPAPSDEDLSQVVVPKVIEVAPISEDPEHLLRYGRPMLKLVVLAPTHPRVPGYEPEMVERVDAPELQFRPIRGKAVRDFDDEIDRSANNLPPGIFSEELD